MERTRLKSLLLFSIVVVVAIIIILSARSTFSKAPPGTQSPTAAHSLVAGQYVGAQACSACHQDKFNSWNETNHAQMAGIQEINASGTYYWVSRFGHYVMNQSQFINQCASCHVTGWDAATKTWPDWNSTDPVLAAKLLNVQCELCHGPGTDQPYGTASMVINYSASLCGQCHAQYGDWNNSKHSLSTADLFASGHASNSCLAHMTTQGFIGEPVSINATQGLEPIACVACHDPHSAENETQLRYADITQLCSTCHTGSHHPQGDIFADSPHQKAGLDCTDCHGNGKRLYHGQVEDWFNHTWSIYNDFYPYNQTEPVVCSRCHAQDWATAQLGVIQNLTTDLMNNVTQIITNAKATIADANQTSGVDPAKIISASTTVKAAQSTIDLLGYDKSRGFHNPENTFSMLSDAARLAGEAQMTALTAKAEALGENLTSVESERLALQAQISSLQAQVTSLQNQVNSLQSSTTTSYLYGGIGGAIGFVVGAAIIFAVKKRKK